MARIVVDSSVWIDFLNGADRPHVSVLRGLIGQEAILVGDIVLCEVLQGLRDDLQAAKVERALNRFTLGRMVDPVLAVQAATKYRHLRRLGITVRKTADMLIATYCIEGGYPLLHADRDFEPMREHLGLRTL